MLKMVFFRSALLILLVWQVSGAGSFFCKVDSGSAQIITQNQKRTITDTENFVIGDTIMLNGEDKITLTLDNATSIKLKGPATCTFTGDTLSMKVILDEGQLFFTRDKKKSSMLLTIIAKNYNFEPIGTAAAVKTTPQGNPSAAVLRGKVRMRSPMSDFIDIGPGQFGNIDNSGNLTSGNLPQRAIEQLEQWSGTKLSLNDEEPVAVSSPSVSATPVALNESSVVSTTEPVSVQPQTSQPSISDAPGSEPVENVPQQQSASQVQAKPVVNTPPAQTQNSAQANETKAAENEKASKTPESKGGKSSPKWELSAGTATVDGEQWTKIGLGVDIPIWRFGVFLDLELFLDSKGQFSNKGWDFKDNWGEAITRKIRYIRYGQENDPLYAKFGGLSNVTLGYGFLFDNFTNMLHYPDEKYPGLQVYLNDITPAGITLQTVIADLKELGNDGGVVGARLAFKPLKTLSVPIIKNLSIGGTYATDLNEFTGAKKWRFSGDIFDKDNDGIQDLFYYQQKNIPLYMIDTLIAKGAADTSINVDTTYRDSVSEFSLVGADIGVPIISNSLINVTVYGQLGVRADGFSNGWGIGAPGVQVAIWRLNGNIEYRHTEGKFKAGYFDYTYLDDRLLRAPTPTVKSRTLKDDTLNGVFGKIGFDIANVVVIEGRYQHLIGKTDESSDKRFEAKAVVGEQIISRIPKIKKAEVYYLKTEIGKWDKLLHNSSLVNYTPQYDKFFEKTPYMSYGYRIGFEMSPGAMLICDNRYGFELNENNKLVSNNNISIQAAVSF